MKKYIVILLFSLFLINCSSKESDEAKKITQRFYTLLKKNNRDEIFKLYGNELFKVASKKQVNQMFDTSSAQFGNIKNDSLIYEQTNIIKETHSKKEYILIYNVNRDIKNTQEKFTLHYQGDSIKIVGYFISPINN
jgi:putative heme degradation protein